MTAAMNAARSMIAATEAPAPPRPFRVTFFPNKAASTLEEKEMTIWDLRDLVLSTNAGRKKGLTFLKLAKFGDVPSPQNCLRTNENLIEIDGVELDYDLEKMPFDEAVTRLRKAKILFLAYTSPTHTPTKPRWRLLAFTSRPLPPTERTTLLKRLNGLVGGVASGESWTLSQSFYFGSVNKNPHTNASIYNLYQSASPRRPRCISCKTGTHRK